MKMALKETQNPSLVDRSGTQLMVRFVVQEKDLLRKLAASIPVRGLRTLELLDLDGDVVWTSRPDSEPGGVTLEHPLTDPPGRLRCRRIGPKDGLDEASWFRTVHR